MAERILVVEDDAAIVEGLATALRAEGYEVDSATDGPTGYERAAASNVDLMILDVMLPGMSGLDALPRFSEVVPGVPVVMMSGRATLSDAVEATRRGAFHFIEKPLTPDRIRGLNPAFRE